MQNINKPKKRLITTQKNIAKPLHPLVLRSLHAAVLAVLTLTTLLSCQRTTDDSEDSCFSRYAVVEDLYNRDELDSLVMLVPPTREYLLKHGDMELYYHTWRLLADMYAWSDNFSDATREALAMQKDAIARDNDFGLSISYLSQATCYTLQGNTDEAIRCYETAVNSFPEDGNVGILMEAYAYLLDNLDSKKDYKAYGDVLQRLHSTLQHRLSLQRNHSDEAIAQWYFTYYFHLSTYLVIEGRLQEAAVAVDSVQYFSERGTNYDSDKFQVCTIRYDLAMAQQDYEQALHYAEQSMQYAGGLNSNKRRALQMRYGALEKLGRYQEALVDMKQFNLINDSITQEQNREQLNEMNKRFQVNEMQAEISQQRIIGLVVAMVLLIVFFLVYTLHRQRAQKRLAAEQAARERMEGELRIARDIQMSMVPSVFPQREGLDMYASMTPARQVGGDLYGYLLQDDKLYFAVGDVSGKGVPASLFMAQATRLFLTLAKQGLMPAAICTQMNDALSGDDNENGMFVTFFLGLVDLQTGHLDFCNAGHNPPVIGGSERGGDFLQMESNAPLGLWPGLQYVGEQIDSIKGRPLFIYTDGLNEAENPRQQQFGDDRLLAVLRDTRFDHARHVIETLHSQVEAHRHGADPNDDLTMMCLRIS